MIFRTIFFFAGCFLLLGEWQNNAMASSESFQLLEVDVRELPEGASWRDVFDESEGNLEWEARTYELGANDISFRVSLQDPIYPEDPELSYEVVLMKDDQGFPFEYRMFLRTAVCLAGTCKLLETTLFWDALGRYVRYEYPKGNPFTKTEHDALTDAEYLQLHRFLIDDRSILGTHPLDYFVVIPDEGTEGWDTESHATPPAARTAVVEGAAYTTWVLWRWVHGEITTQLVDRTREQISDDYLLSCLRSDDSGFVQFALNEILKTGFPDTRFYGACLAILDERGIRDSSLALNVLSAHHQNSEQLHVDLIKRIGMNDGSIRVIMDYFRKLDTADPSLWRQLAAQIAHINSYDAIERVFDLLKQRSPDDSGVREQISWLALSEDPFLREQAEAFLR